MPSKESLELRAEKWLSEIRYDSSVGRGNRGLMPHHIAQLKGPLADLLDEAIREAALKEAEWWQRQIESRRHGMRFFKQEDGQKGADRIEAEHVAQLREGKP